MNLSSGQNINGFTTADLEYRTINVSLAKRTNDGTGQMYTELHSNLVEIRKNA